MWVHFSAGPFVIQVSEFFPFFRPPGAYCNSETLFKFVARAKVNSINFLPLRCNNKQFFSWDRARIAITPDNSQVQSGPPFCVHSYINCLENVKCRAKRSVYLSWQLWSRPESWPELADINQDLLPLMGDVFQGFWLLLLIKKVKVGCSWMRGRKTLPFFSGDQKMRPV